jgi:hypothetical protein
MYERAPRPAGCEPARVCPLYSELYADPARPVNVARFVFLNPRARTFFVAWATAANDMVAALQAEAGSNPYDRELSDLVGELSTRSEEFAAGWAAQNVRFHRSGLKTIHHPIVGQLQLTFEALALPADAGLSLVVYGAEPGSPSEDGLRCWPAGPPPSMRPTRSPPTREAGFAPIPH